MVQVEWLGMQIMSVRCVKRFLHRSGKKTIWCGAPWLHLKESGEKNSFIQVFQANTKHQSLWGFVLWGRSDESEGKPVVLHIPGNIMHNSFKETSRLTELMLVHVCQSIVTFIYCVHKMQHSRINTPESELLQAAVSSYTRWLIITCEDSHDPTVHVMTS